MKGMYSMEWYIWFSEKDQYKFEDRLCRWAKQRGKRAVMIFDRDSLVVGTTMKVGENNYLVKLPNSSIEYICITGNMCILRKIIRKDGESEALLYEMPDHWDGTTPWHAQ